MSLIDSTVDLETGRPIETTAKIRLCRSFTVKVADMDGAGKRMERHEVIFLRPFTFSFAGNSSICMQAKSHRFISEATPEGLVEQTSRPNHLTKLFLEFRPHCGLPARASTVLTGPAYSTAGLLEKSSKIGRSSKPFRTCTILWRTQRRRAADVIRGEGNRLASTPTHPDRAHHEPWLSM